MPWEVPLPQWIPDELSPLQWYCSAVIWASGVNGEECYAHLDYLYHITYLFYPVICLALAPAFIVVFLGLSSLFLFVYQWRHWIREAYTHSVWRAAIRGLSVFWHFHSRVCHGYEVRGLENLPSKGPALLIYYHGALPLDMYYTIAHVFLHRNRHIKAIGDNFLFKIPGLQLLLSVLGVERGSVDRCVSLLKQGELISIAPGGVREAQFSTHLYEIIWANRVGFAKVAIKANIPIIPVFTKNIREVFRTLQYGKSIWKWFYEKTRIPIGPVYGGFPVKLITYLGSPIIPQPNQTPQELASQVKTAIENMIHRHQDIPGKIGGALLDRFRNC